ncbi:MAG: NAD(P)-dependent alcohol dehydrogenase [Bdellovibrionia bacterium]
MLKTTGYAAKSPTTPIEPFSFGRREVGPGDVRIKILYCGICHSDIHQAKDEWGGSIFPMVPGHEIVGQVIDVGKKVKRFKLGDFAGVGCFVDSCGKCKSCKANVEQFCEKHTTLTYNSLESDGKTPSYGGYSSQIVVNQNYVLKVSKKAPLERVAPLLCAGITTYAPLKRYGVKKGQKIGVVGLGGLGHMGVKLAASMGAEVTVFSTSPAKEKDAKRLGAKNFVITPKSENQIKKQNDSFSSLAEKFDLILDTVAAPHDLNMFLRLLKRDGTMVLIGVPPKPYMLEAYSLIGGQKRLTGSLIGGIKETQEMLDYCTRKKVFSDVEVIDPTRINEAYERTSKGDVKYRFVIDLKNE